MSSIDKITEYTVSVVPGSLLTERPAARPVRVLNDIVVNQIAAGEVVERPSSVVKELVENALDAGGRDITIAIANGGKTLIEIVDDGCGMGKQDALLALERFGTSKISSTEDLVSIASLGFRGEALPSIASVSELTLETKCVDEPGVQIQVVGGTLRDVQVLDKPIGTRIKVRRLFFNTPARRRFLRADKTEEAQIRSTIYDFACAYPQCRFRLIVDGKEGSSFVPAENLFERAKLLGLAGRKPIEIAERLTTQIGEIFITAVLSQPLECVSGSNRLRLIVNGRIVRDKLLIRAIRDGYGNFLKGGMYPAGILSLQLNPAEVDVNVHPQKAEVRFRSPQAIFGVIALTLKKAFDVHGVLPQRAIPQNSWEKVPAFGSTTRVSLNSSYPQTPALFAVSQPMVREDTVARVPSEQVHSELRYMGQLFKLYLLFEGKEALSILDMHAAHERVRFYEIKQGFLNGIVPSQLLLVPEIVELTPDEAVRIADLLPALQQLGLECDIDDQAIVVRALPAALAISREGRTDARSIMRDILSLAPGADAASFLQHRLDEVIARLACHGSVRSGRVLEPAEAYALLDALIGAERSGLCPHGRPVITELAQAELERLFGRVQ